MKYFKHQQLLEATLPKLYIFKTIKLFEYKIIFNWFIFLKLVLHSLEQFQLNLKCLICSTQLRRYPWLEAMDPFSLHPKLDRYSGHLSQ